MLVGEQPGDREDVQGHPFVGPAGGVLDRGLEAAGIERGEVYLTNVVKHFRYKLPGGRRIHQSPERWQVRACQPWLHAELDIVRPRALVCLGATAAQALPPVSHPPRSRNAGARRGNGAIYRRSRAGGRMCARFRPQRPGSPSW